MKVKYEQADFSNKRLDPRKTDLGIGNAFQASQSEAPTQAPEVVLPGSATKKVRQHHSTFINGSRMCLLCWMFTAGAGLLLVGIQYGESRGDSPIFSELAD